MILGDGQFYLVSLINIFLIFFFFFCKNTYFCPFCQFLGPNATWSGDNGNYIWYKQVYKFREVGYSVDYLIDFSVTTDLKNSSWRILDLDQPGLGMSREYLSKGIQDEDVQVRVTVQKSQFFKRYILGQPNWEYSKWKFQRFSATQILHEINFGHFEAPKTAIF